MADETRRLHIDGSELTLHIKRSARRKRRLSLSFQANGDALLQAPLRASNRDIEAMLGYHRDWLKSRHRQLLERLRQHPPVRFVNGATLPFKGEPVALRVRQRPGPGRCHWRDGELWVALASAGETEVERLVERWYRRQARCWFEARLSHWSAALSWVRQPPPLRLRRMRSRWGSCSSSGEVCLNSELVKLPQRYLDYVVVHELCHLQEFNHSPHFYALMSSVMPDWAERRRELHNRVLPTFL